MTLKKCRSEYLEVEGYSTGVAADSADPHLESPRPSQPRGFSFTHHPWPMTTKGVPM